MGIEIKANFLMITAPQRCYKSLIDVRIQTPWGSCVLSYKHQPLHYIITSLTPLYLYVESDDRCLWCPDKWQAELFRIIITFRFKRIEIQGTWSFFIIVPMRKMVSVLRYVRFEVFCIVLRNEFLEGHINKKSVKMSFKNDRSYDFCETIINSLLLLNSGLAV